MANQQNNNYTNFKNLIHLFKRPTNVPPLRDRLIYKELMESFSLDSSSSSNQSQEETGSFSFLASTPQPSLAIKKIPLARNTTIQNTPTCQSATKRKPTFESNNYTTIKKVRTSSDSTPQPQKFITSTPHHSSSGIKTHKNTPQRKSVDNGVAKQSETKQAVFQTSKCTTIKQITASVTTPRIFNMNPNNKIGQLFNQNFQNFQNFESPYNSPCTPNVIRNIEKECTMYYKCRTINQSAFPSYYPNSTVNVTVTDKNNSVQELPRRSICHFDSNIATTFTNRIPDFITTENEHEFCATKNDYSKGHITDIENEPENSFGSVVGQDMANTSINEDDREKNSPNDVEDELVSFIDSHNQAEDPVSDPEDESEDELMSCIDEEENVSDVESESCIGQSDVEDQVSDVESDSSLNKEDNVSDVESESCIGQSDVEDQVSDVENDSSLNKEDNVKMVCAQDKSSFDQDIEAKSQAFEEENFVQDVEVDSSPIDNTQVPDVVFNGDENDSSFNEEDNVKMVCAQDKSSFDQDIDAKSQAYEEENFVQDVEVDLSPIDNTQVPDVVFNENESNIDHEDVVKSPGRDVEAESYSIENNYTEEQSINDQDELAARHDNIIVQVDDNDDSHLQVQESVGKIKTKLKNKLFKLINEKPQQIIKPNDFSSNTRRSHRNRTLPLQFWRGERPIYKTQDVDGIVINTLVGVKSIQEFIARKKREKLKKKANQTKPAQTTEVPQKTGTRMENVLDLSINLSRAKKILKKSETNEEDLKHLFPYSNYTWKDSNKSKGVYTAITKKNEKNAFGLLRFDPKSTKANSKSSYEAIFTVIYGALILTVNSKNSLITPGTSFEIEKDTQYSIKNGRSDDALISFAAIRK